jgi:DNA-directed RNA polymerase specialized sigma24 family protein
MRWRRRVAGERDEYVSKEGFVGVFESEQAGLQRLALLLTANSDAAAQCLSLALQQCFAVSFVFKGWALTWVRRMVIRNAIGLLIGPESRSVVNTNDDADDMLIAFPPDDSLSAIAGSESILDLPEFDRFVFVICALERYSVHDCAVLLRRSLRDINDARHRTSRQLEHFDDFGNRSLQVTMR